MARPTRSICICAVRTCSPAYWPSAESTIAASSLAKQAANTPTKISAVLSRHGLGSSVFDYYRGGRPAGDRSGAWTIFPSNRRLRICFQKTGARMVRIGTRCGSRLPCGIKCCRTFERDGVKCTKYKSSERRIRTEACTPSGIRSVWISQQPAAPMGFRPMI